MRGEKEESVTLFESQMLQVWEWGEKTPAFFADVAEGALLSGRGDDVGLEAWPALSSERLSPDEWSTHVGSTACVVAPRASGAAGVL